MQPHANAMKCYGFLCLFFFFFFARTTAGWLRHRCSSVWLSFNLKPVRIYADQSAAYRRERGRGQKPGLTRRLNCVRLSEEDLQDSSCSCFIFQNKSNISHISTRYNCDLQVFSLNGFRCITCNYLCLSLFTVICCQ